MYRVRPAARRGHDEHEPRRARTHRSRHGNQADPKRCLDHYMNGDNLGLVERDSTSRRHYLLPRLASWMLVALSCISCATARTTDPNRTATEQFLVSAAATRAVDQLTPTTLRDRRVFIDSSYLFAGVASNDQSFLLGELRAKLLTNGVRLVKNREEAQIVLEVRAGALSV